MLPGGVRDPRTLYLRHYRCAVCGGRFAEPFRSPWDDPRPDPRDAARPASSPCPSCGDDPHRSPFRGRLIAHAVVSGFAGLILSAACVVALTAPSHTVTAPHATQAISVHVILAF